MEVVRASAMPSQPVFNLLIYVVDVIALYKKNYLQI